MINEINELVRSEVHIQVQSVALLSELSKTYLESYFPQFLFKVQELFKSLVHFLEKVCLSVFGELEDHLDHNRITLGPDLIQQGFQLMLLLLVLLGSCGVLFSVSIVVL